MESIRDVKEALSARSTTASIDELRERGRQRVRVIRAEHIASLIEEAVQRAISESGLIPKEELDALTERSRQEFSGLVAERQREAQELVRLREELGRLKAQLSDAEQERERAAGDAAGHAGRIADLQVELGEVRATLADTESALAVATERAEQQRAALEGLHEELEAERQRAAELEEQQTAATDPETNPALRQMMREIEALRAEVGSRNAPATAPALPDLAGQMAQALAGLTRSMDERLDKLGRKMGISSAVDAQAVKLDGLFDDVGTAPVESNFDSVEVKAKKSGGIGAHLDKLRRLKGGQDAS